MIGFRFKTLGKEIDTNTYLATIEVLQYDRLTQEESVFQELTLSYQNKTPSKMQDLFIVRDPSDAVYAQSDVVSRGLNIPGMTPGKQTPINFDIMDEETLARMFSNTGLAPEQEPMIFEDHSPDADIGSIADKIVADEKARRGKPPVKPITAETINEESKALVIQQIPLEEAPVEAQ
jgi:hypothetical protein